MAKLTAGIILQEAWQLTDGNKMVLNIAALIMFVVSLVFGVVLGVVSALLVGEQPSLAQGFIELVINLVFYAVYAVLLAGIYLMAARIATRETVQAADVTRYLPRAGVLLVTYILMTLMCFIGFMLLVLPGIYLSVAYMMALPLAAEKGLSPWQALESSRKAITPHWWTVFALMLVFAALMIVGLITLGIAFIWLFPLMMLVMGILYRDLFGLENDELAA